MDLPSLNGEGEYVARGVARPLFIYYMPYFDMGHVCLYSLFMGSAHVGLALSHIYPFPYLHALFPVYGKCSCRAGS